jgi:nucleoside-diphosphate-sugar epimerase
MGEGTRVAVTGGGGFIGHALVVDQARRGRGVASLDVSHPTTLPADVAPRVRRLDGSILDAAVVARAFEGCGLVFHLASAHLEVRHGEKYFRSVNVDGTRSVAEAAAAAGVPRVVHVSTVGVYGQVRGRPYTEESPTRPTIAYERTKLEAEEEVRRCARRLGIGVVVVRPSWIYGAGCRRTRKIFEAVRRGRFLMVGGGRVRRDGLYVDDCVAGLDLCGRHPAAPGETFVLASGEAPSVTEWVEEIAAAQGARPPWLKVPAAPMWLLGLGLELSFKLLGKDAPFSRRSLKFFTNGTVFDPSKIRSVLGFSPQVTWREGIRRTAADLARGPAKP